jgi:hypothetical protein
MTTDASVRSIVKDELTLTFKDGNPGYEAMQALAIANNEYVRQMKDDFGNYAAAATDAVLKDDFQQVTAATNEKLSDLSSQVATLTDLVRQLNNKP